MWSWRKRKRVEERGDRSHHALYPSQMLGIFLLQVIQERGNVGTITPQLVIVIDIGKSLHGRLVTRVMEMIYLKLLQQRANIPSLAELLVLYLRLRLVLVEYLAIPLPVSRL